MIRQNKVDRIVDYAKQLRPGVELTASDVVQNLGQRNITERSVGLVFRSLPEMQMVPIARSGRNRWRRV
jgi:alkylated DNA nucleotide flippase Atl1